MIAQTTKGNDESTIESTLVSNGVQVEEQHISEVMNWEEILKLQGISARTRKPSPRPLRRKPRNPISRAAFFLDL